MHDPQVGLKLEQCQPMVILRRSGSAEGISGHIPIGFDESEADVQGSYVKLRGGSDRDHFSESQCRKWLLLAIDRQFSTLWRIAIRAFRPARASRTRA